MKELYIQKKDTDYNIKTKGNINSYFTTMRRGKQGWTPQAQGELVVTIFDSGDNIIVGVDGQTVTLDYAQADDLMMAILAHQKNTDPNYSGFTLSERVEICSVS